MRTIQWPRRTQSLNSAHVEEARKPASVIAWRSDSSQWGSNARRLASAHPMHASTSSAATTAIAIAPVERASAECLERACVRARAFSVDLKGVTAVVLVVAGCTLADAGTGKVGVELV